MCHDHDWLRIAEAEGEPAADPEADVPTGTESAEERATADEEPALVPPAVD